jgi:hypothetical protein
MPYLPVDTAVVVEVGPLIDDTDFKSLEEAIAYDESNMDVDLLKKSATSLTKTDITLTSGGTSDWTHKGSGVYEVEITQAQNDTEGSLRLVGLCDGVLPFESPVYTVVPQVVYNALVAGSDKLEVDVNQVGGTAVPETDGKLHVLDDAGNTVANESKQDTMDTVVDAIKAKTDNLPTDPADASVIAGLLATIAAYIDTEVGAIKAKTDNIPASPAPASEYDTEMARITANVATEAKQDIIDTAVDSILEDTGTTLPATLATIAAYLDTEIQAILDDTNELQGDWTDGGRLDLILDSAAAGAGGDATQAKQNTIITHLTDVKGATFAGATDSLEAIRNRGDSAWVTGGTGGGSETWVFTLTESGSGEPVADASVWVTADEAGEGEVIASGYTDNFGKITFYLDAGTYYFWAEKAGWNFTNPYTQVVS